jgi:hypothetical protein
METIFYVVYTILSAFENLRKAEIKLVMPVRPHGTTRPFRTDFYEISYLCSFRKSVEKV